MKTGIFRRVQLLGLFLLLNLCFYGIFCVEHFSADTYVTEVYGWFEIADLYWSNGRWLMTLLCVFCDVFHIGFATEKVISWGLALVFLSLAELLLYEMIRKRISIEEKLDAKWFLALLTSFMMLSNLFLLEYFIFPEYTGPICVGIFFNVLEVRYVLRFLEERSWKYLAAGLCFGILGIMGHQGAFGITAVLLILLAEDTFSDIKNFIRNTVVIGAAYLAPAVTNVFQTKLAGSARVAEEVRIAEALETAIRQSYELLLSTANFMPRKVYVVLCMAAGLAVLLLILWRKNGKQLLHALYATFIFALAILAPFFMTEPEHISVVPRTVYVMGAGLPVVLLCLLLMKESMKWPVQAAVLYALVFLGIQYFNTCQIETSHYVSNGIDYYDVNYIEQQVYLYETETGNKVSKIKIYSDESPVGIYYNLTGYGAVNERVMANGWAAANAYQVFSGRQIIVEEGDPAVFETYFKGKNWNFLDDEQIVLIGDTLHLCLY